MTGSLTEEEFERVAVQLGDIRRSLIGSLVPLVSDWGFKIFPNANISAPTVMLPPKDYELFNQLIAAAPPAHPPIEAAHPETPASPPAGGGLTPILDQHVLYKNTDYDIPPAILDRNGDVVLSCCKRCGLAEIELERVPVCPGSEKAGRYAINRIREL